MFTIADPTSTPGIDLSVHLRKGKFTSQEEKLVDDAITDFLSARGFNREHDLVRMLFGEGFLGAGDGEAGVNDGAGGAAGQKTRAKNKDRVELVKAIGESLLSESGSMLTNSLSSQHPRQTAHVN